MMILKNKIQYFIFVSMVLIPCFLCSCLVKPSSLSSENKSGIYFSIQQDDSKFIGYLGVPKDNKSLVVCVDKNECQLEEGKIVGASFVKDVKESKIYKINDSAKLSSKIEVIRDDGNKRKIEISKSNISGGNIGDLQIIQLTKRTNSNNSAYGEVLNDIISYYLPKTAACFDHTKYASPVKPNYAHEATHGLNGCIRNKNVVAGKKIWGFYLLEGKAAVVEEPNIKKSMVANYVPNTLKNMGDKCKDSDSRNHVDCRFDTYIIGETTYEHNPLKVLDEWVAYINGSKETISLINSNKPTGGDKSETHLLHGVIELMVYSSALVQAVSKGDPNYFKTNTQFKALFKYLFQTTVSIYNQGKGNSILISKSAIDYVNKFKNSELYSFITKNFGDLGL